jgi:serine/threonine protein kinase
MEFCDVGSLDKVLEITKTIPEFIISKIAKQVLKGLKYIHEQNSVHRDIKPGKPPHPMNNILGNILLNRSGEIKIADFGMVTSFSI